MSSDNVVIDIDSITIETLSTPETTYNFEVADYHTYYVCESGVLVHNRCKLGKNMEKNGNIGKPGEDAHHIFPKKFESKFFDNAKIQIDDATNGVWLDMHAHRQGAFAYNNAWAGVIDIIDENNVWGFARKFMQEIYHYDI